jgi:cytochrome c oxidase subunit 1
MGTLKSWLFTVDHKRIGILYLTGSFAAFILAGIAALIIRTQQIGPTAQFVTAQEYHQILHFHGAAMILAFLIPGLTGFFGSYVLPMMIGAREVAFPRLNAMALWMYYGGVLLAVVSTLVPDAPDIMWTGYPPYSIKTTSNTAFYVFTVDLFAISFILLALNLVTTVIYMRAPGVRWGKLNMLVWCMLSALIMNIIDLPVLMVAVNTLLTDKYLGTRVFDPDIGGPLLYLNLFWFYSHPAVYVMFMPAMGVLFDVIATMAKNRVFNYKAAAYLGVFGTTFISGEVWVHHIFTSGMPDWLRVIMMITTLFISVPVGVMIVSLWGTLYKGSITFNVAMYYAAACLFLLLIGGLTGIPLAMVSMNLHLHGTTYVHAHFHFVMALFATFAFLSGLYYWFPKITGRMADTGIARLAFWINMVGVNLTFWPLLIIGAEGMPRRYWNYPAFPDTFSHYHVMATVGAGLTALGMALALGNLVYCARRGTRAEANPWGSSSLEWTHTATPPVPGNFSAPLELAADWTPYNYSR